MAAAALKSTQIRNVAVSKLAISPFNVRRTQASEADDNELKASILANGVGQNLIVHSKREAGKETFLVAAGGRRLSALQALLTEERIKPTFEVPVRVVSAKEAEEISLAENAIRASMHPADEFEAFARLIDGGATIEEVATRFGTSPVNVERRMKLGKLHPDLLALFREGCMTLETVKALTITADHDRQWQAWEATESERRYNRNGVHYIVRRILTAEGLSSVSRIGRLVDVEKYEAEGGTFARDLFGGHDGDGIVLTFENVALAEKLALKALEQHAAPLRDEWKWVEVALEPEPHRQGWSRLNPVPIDVPEDVTAEHDRVCARIVELEEIDDEDDWTDAMGDELDALYERRAELTMRADECLGFTPEQKAASGVIVGPGHDGMTEAKGILNPEDIAAIEEANRAARAEADAAAEEVRRAADADRDVGRTDDSGEDGGSSDGATCAETEDGSQRDEDAGGVADMSATPAPVAPAILPGQPAGLARTAEAIENGEVETGRKDAPIHSQALDLDLRQTRRQILAAHVAGDFGSAFDMLLWQMAKGILTVSYVHGEPLECRFTPERDAAGSASLEDTAASALIAAHKDALLLDFLGVKDAGESFAALCAMPDEDKQALFALCVSTMLVRQSTPVIEAIGSRLNVDVAAFWRPTAENYWGRVKKDVCLAAARETVGTEWVAARKDQKKAVLAQSMEALFADGKSVSIAPEGIRAAKAWLPEGMAFAVTEATDESETAVRDTAAVDDAAADHGGPDCANDDETAEVIEVPAFLRGAA